MFRVSPEAAASAASFGGRSKQTRPQPAQSDGFSVLVDSNASATQDTERTAHPAPDVPTQRLEGGDTQSKADNRPDTKTDNSPGGKGKSQASHAANSNGETAVDAEDPSQQASTAETSVTGDTIAIVLSSEALAAAAEPKPVTDDTSQTAEATNVATPAIPAIVASAASAVAAAIPVASAAANEIAAPAPERDTKIATIQSTVATSAATASSSPDAPDSAVAIPVSTGAPPATLTTGRFEATSVATNTTNTAAADEAAKTATANAASSQIVSGETASRDPELAANAAASAQAAVAVPATGKEKTTAAAPTTPTQVLTSADAEAASAPNPAPAPSLPGHTADAAAPRGAEVIGGAADKIGSPADKAEAPPSDPKQSNTPVAAPPAEHRAPAAPTHSASLDPSLQQAQAPPPQSFQAQTPNVVVTPAAQLNATLANTPVPINGLAVDIALRAAGGASRFEIRLDPAELGRIDVRLDVDKHGNVTSHLTVEKPATLDMLRRDAPQLQRALEDAGLKTGDSGLQFSLRDQSSSGRNDGNGSSRNMQRLVISEDDTVPAQVAGKTYGRMLGSSGGVDIRV